MIVHYVLNSERLGNKEWGISHLLGSGLGSDSKPSLSWATNVNILQLRSEIPSLHWKSELNLVHTEGSAQVRLRLSSEFAELSSEPSHCEMPQNVSLLIGLYKNNGSVSYVGITFLLISSLYMLRTLEVRFTWNKKDCVILTNRRKDIIQYDMLIRVAPLVHTKKFTYLVPF